MRTNNRNKDKSFLLSSQVQKLLYKKGYSHLFNWDDYNHFKKLTKNAFNQALEITEHFISESNCKSDFADYVF